MKNNLILYRKVNNSTSISNLFFMKDVTYLSRYLVSLVILLVSGINFLHAQTSCNTWLNVGSAGFTSGMATYTNVAVDKYGNSYVAYVDNTNGNKVSVMKCSSNTWMMVGSAGFSAGAAAYVSLTLDTSGTPYVAFEDGGNNNKATVMKYNGTNWVNLASAGISSGAVLYTSLALDKFGNVFVAYLDGANANKATVMKYNGTSWSLLGSAGFSAWNISTPAIAVDTFGTPYVTYQDAANNYKATVMKFNGTAWVNVGSAGFSAGTASYTSIALDLSGLPYVAFEDGNNSGKLTIMKYTGSSWIILGSAGISASATYYSNIQVDKHNNVFVSYLDAANSSSVSVLKYSGNSWSTLGSAGITGAQIDYPSLALDTSGTPYIAFVDYNNNQKATEKIFTVAPTPIVNAISNQSLCNNTSSAAVVFSSTVNGTTYSWTNSITTIGLAANGSGNIASFIAANNSNIADTSLIIVTPNANGCIGNSVSFKIIVNPTPSINALNSQTVCANAATTPISFSGSLVNGTIYNWSNNTSSIGLASSGTGNISSFTALNSGTSAITAHIIVTPVYNGCSGSNTSLNLTVNPLPGVSLPASQYVCNGASINPVVFFGTVAGTTFTWANSMTAIGIAASGTGTIAATTVNNNSSVIDTAVFTLSGTANACSASLGSFKIVVYPTPSVNSINNQTLCNGTLSSPITFSGSTVANTSYSWTNNTSGIGLALSGTGNIAAFNAINSSTNPITAGMTVSPIANGCSGSAKTFSYIINPTPTVSLPGNQILCNGNNTNAITFSGNLVNSTYNWTNSLTITGLAASGSGNISSFTALNTSALPDTSVITVIPTANACSGAAVSFSIIVNPTPTLNNINNQSVCVGSAVAAVALSGSAVAGTTYNWVNTNSTIGLALNGSGNIAAFTSLNPFTIPQSSTITVTPLANNCSGSSKTFTITVNPIPTVSVPSNQTICSNTLSAALNFTGTVSGTTFSWTNANTNIGLAGSGTGNISAFTALNSGTTAISGNIVVTPTFNGCNGTPGSFTITVNPSPTANIPNNQMLCNGAATSAISFSGGSSGTSYTWQNSMTAIGLISNGIGNIPSFNAINTGTVIDTAILTLSASLNSCTLVAGSFKIIVYPTPTLSAISNVAFCNGLSSSPISFSGSAVANTIYNWSNGNTAIGIANTGTGTIAAFNIINNGATPILDTINVTPVANGCSGSSKTFTITANPTPVVTVPNTQVICNGSSTALLSFNSNVSGTTYAWANSMTAIGLATSGSGPIASFTALNTSTVPDTAIITVTPTANTCVGVGHSFKVVVNPSPSVNSLTNQTVCSGVATSSVIPTGSAVAGTVYNWSNANTAIGLVASGSGAIPSFSAANNGTTQINSVVTVTPVANACNGAAKTFTFYVNPIPSVTTPTNQTICNNTNSSLVSFISTVNSSTFNWTNSNSSIGLAATGTGNIPIFNAIDTSLNPLVSALSVTPTAAGCIGTTKNFIFTVNPTPVYNTPASQVFCNLDNVGNINFSSPVNGTVFSWINNQTAIGLASSGTGNIGGFVALNSGYSIDSALITFHGTANSCIGANQSFHITVKPSPSVSSISNQTFCNGNTTNTIYISGSGLAGTVYNWTNSDTTIGLSATGTGNINSFTATNIGIAPVQSQVVVVPTFNGCNGSPKQFNFTVNPIPILGTVYNQTVCNNDSFSTLPMAGPVGNTTYYWTNSNPGIGLTYSGSGTIPAFLGTNTTTAPVTSLLIITPVANNCSGAIDTVRLTVNPTPKLSSATIINPICDSSLLSYTPTSATTGTVFTWFRDTVAGISNLAASGTNNPNENLYNSTDTPVVLKYIDTLSANGCVNIQTVWLTVNPTPKLSSTVTPPAICNNTVFTYVSQSNTPGTTFSWARYPQVGISDSGVGGINNPSETLHDTTANPVNVVYFDTLKAYGCVHTEAVIVMVNPSPRLSSGLLDTVCSGSPFIYVPSSATNNFTYTWVRDTVIGVTPYSSNGTGSINDTLTGSGIPISVLYHFVLSINNCSDSEDMKLTINPLPLLPSIDTKCPATVCENTMYANFGTNYPSGSIKSYIWTATNATIYELGSGNQYCLVNFPNAGNATIKLVAMLNATGCTNERDYTVNVSNNTIGITPDIIYVQGQFVCLDNTADAYQWGYDDANTLDSTLLVGKNTQSFYDPNADLVNKYYWVLVTKNGCTQKYYYNMPVSATPTLVKTNQSLTLYPNPTTDRINILINGTISDHCRLVLSNMMGAVLLQRIVTENKTELSISDLPSGFYNIAVYNGNENIGHATLIKN